MTALKNYLKDGAHYNARAVMVLLQSYDFEGGEPTIARWENCREQGYVVSLTSKNYSRKLHIAFFEHRNSDEICAVKWEQNNLINSPNIDTAEFGDKVYKTKYDISHSVSYNQCYDMAQWIRTELVDFWNQTKDELNNFQKKQLEIKNNKDK